MPDEMLICFTRGHKAIASAAEPDFAAKAQTIYNNNGGSNSQNGS